MMLQIIFAAILYVRALFQVSGMMLVRHFCCYFTCSRSFTSLWHDAGKAFLLQLYVFALFFDSLA